MKLIIVTLLLTHVVIGTIVASDHFVSNAKALANAKELVKFQGDIEAQPQLQTKSPYGDKKYAFDYTSKQTVAECCRYSCYSCTERTLNSWCCLPCIIACVSLKKCCGFKK